MEDPLPFLFEDLESTYELTRRHWWSRRRLWRWRVLSTLSVDIYTGAPIVRASGWADSEQEAVRAINCAVDRERSPALPASTLPNFREHPGSHDRH